MLRMDIGEWSGVGEDIGSGYESEKKDLWSGAEELFVQVMETFKKKLGADHPDMLTSMANLASTYRNQGRWEAAEELFVQVMETFKPAVPTLLPVAYPNSPDGLSQLPSQ